LRVIRAESAGVECYSEFWRIGVPYSLFGRRNAAALVAALSIALTCAVYAQNAGDPQPVPLPPPIVAPVDTAYPGTISLSVDITNINDRVMNVHETVPVKGREITLLYPEWLPGTHSPSNPVGNMAGLVITANGKRVGWVRDRVNMYAFHIHVQQGVTTLEINFQYLAPQDPKKGRISSSFADVTWNSVLLYPAGYFSRRIQFDTTIKLPEGWKFATALQTASQDGSLVHFKPTTLNTLVDSPLYAGVNFKRVDLSTGADNQVFLDVFSDKPADLEITPEELQYHKNLVIEAQKLFNSRHYDHYDFLFSLSDTVSGKGWNTISPARMAPAPTTSPIGLRAFPVVLFCPTNTPIRGTASFAGPPTCGRPISTCRCRTTCSGSMKA
jgi:hypothetical protein